jgi:hypothetical protein
MGYASLALRAVGRARADTPSRRYCPARALHKIVPWALQNYAGHSTAVGGNEALLAQKQTSATEWKLLTA